MHDQRAIRDDQCVRSKNLVPTREGMAAKRGAIEATAGPIIFSDTSSYITSLQLPPANFGNGFVVGMRAFTDDPGALYQSLTSVIVSRQLGDLPGAPASQEAAITWDHPSRYRPLILSYNKKVYTFAGHNNVIVQNPAVFPPELALPAAVLGKYGAIIQEVSPGGALQVVPFNFLASEGGAVTEPDAAPNVAAAYRNRILWADFGPGQENMVVISDPYQPQVVGADFRSANGRHFLVGSIDGDRIVAMREVLLTSVGSAAEAAALVLRQYSAYLITGEPNLVADGSFILGDMDVNRINIDCGCSSADTLVNTPYGLLWAGWDDVWLFPQGQGIPLRVGSNIRPILAATPPELRYLWHASYFDGFYRLHLLSPGQNEGDASVPGEEWRLDLRRGPPASHEQARWYGPMVYKSPTPTATPKIGVEYAIADTRPSVTPRLVGVTRSQDFEWPVEFERSAPKDFMTNTVLGASQGTAIDIDWLGKEDDFQDPMIEKGCTGLELNLWVGAAAQLTADVIVDGGRKTETVTETVPPVGFILEEGVLDTTGMTREFQSLRLDPNQNDRINGKTIQVRLRDDGNAVMDLAQSTIAVYPIKRRAT